MLDTGCTAAWARLLHTSVTADAIEEDPSSYSTFVNKAVAMFPMYDVSVHCYGLCHFHVIGEYSYFSLLT